MLCGFGTIRNNTALKPPLVSVVMPVLFWNHSKQHSSKTVLNQLYHFLSFGTIRNNTALKQAERIPTASPCFGTIRNNTALKLAIPWNQRVFRFGTIRNNTALKQ